MYYLQVGQEKTEDGYTFIQYELLTIKEAKKKIKALSNLSEQEIIDTFLKYNAISWLKLVDVKPKHTFMNFECRFVQHNIKLRYSVIKCCYTDDMEVGKVR